MKVFLSQTFLPADWEPGGFGLQPQPPKPKAESGGDTSFSGWAQPGVKEEGYRSWKESFNFPFTRTICCQASFHFSEGRLRHQCCRFTSFQLAVVCKELGDKQHGSALPSRSDGSNADS